MIHFDHISNTINKYLSSNKNAVVFCEGIDDNFFNTLTDISREFPSQCIELPCSENASVGMALGAACYGIIPILCFQRVEFALLALEQLFNNSSKINYLSNGKISNPALFRFVIGRGWGQGPSHSQSFEAVFAQIPRINLFMPVFPEDTTYIINNFDKYDSPSIVLEHRWIHYSESSNIKVNHSEPYIAKKGNLLTIVASSYNVLVCLRVAKIFEDADISIEVINLFAIKPVNNAVISKSIQKTKRLILVELGLAEFGICNSILSCLVQKDCYFEQSPIIIGAKSNFSPSSFRLADSYYLNHKDITNAIIQQLKLKEGLANKILDEASKLDNSSNVDQPNKISIGPF